MPIYLSSGNSRAGGALGRILLCMLVLVLVAVFGLFYAVSERMIGRAGFESHAVVQLHEVGNASEADHSSPLLNASDFDSEETLREVIESEGLVQLWGEDSEDDALDYLRRAVIVQRRRGTDVIEISVVDDDPRVAANIARSIVEVVKEYADSLQDMKKKEHLSDLELLLAQQKERVNEHMAQMASAASDSTAKVILREEYETEIKILEALTREREAFLKKSEAPLRSMTVLSKPIPSKVRRLW